MSWCSRKSANELITEDQKSCEQAEMMAKLKRLGLWAQANPVPPVATRGVAALVSKVAAAEARVLVFPGEIGLVKPAVYLVGSRQCSFRKHQHLKLRSHNGRSPDLGVA